MLLIILGRQGPDTNVKCLKINQGSCSIFALVGLPDQKQMLIPVFFVNSFLVLRFKKFDIISLFPRLVCTN